MSGSEDLVSAARQAREHAQARYSGFKVGAALELPDGTIVTGCNIENATYGLTPCHGRSPARQGEAESICHTVAECDRERSTGAQRYSGSERFSGAQR